ncbi:MAG: glucose-1-phosphate thymidylyltransferase RfbA [Anaerolineales bacterium]|nr:glucose-1-phosphate thymidylyltransferase RfbA [Anaerolineales bacterium]
MKGIILAGGQGTRLYPLTAALNKHLLPVYNKPMIYYPLSVLMLAGIREILIISRPDDMPYFQKMLADGSQWGLQLQYAAQAQPNGIAEALIIGEKFIGDGTVSLTLGDNIFYGSMLTDRLRQAALISHGALVYAYRIMNPKGYAVLDFSRNPDGTILPHSIEEKPAKPKSTFAIPGLYFYDNQVVEMVKSLKPSPRGELEITDINNLYLKQGRLVVEDLGRGVAWLDAGTHETLFQAATFVQAVEERQGMMISCPEEIAYRLGYISAATLSSLLERLPNNPYKQYLLTLVAGSL